jgi:hypothetical protein
MAHNGMSKTPCNTLHAARGEGMANTLRCGSPICPAAQAVGTLIAWKFHWSLYSGSLGVALVASTRTLKSGSHTVISANHHTHVLLR